MCKWRQHIHSLDNLDCLILALRSAGFADLASEVGPLWARRDGNRLLQPYGLQLLKVQMAVQAECSCHCQKPYVLAHPGDGLIQCAAGAIRIEI